MNRPRWGRSLRSTRPTWRALAPSALAGVAVAAGQAPLSLWFVSLPALAFVVARVASAPSAAARNWAGFAAGTGYGAAALFWIVDPFFVDPLAHAWMAPFALAGMATGMGLFWLIAAMLAGLAGPAPARTAFGFAIGLAAADLLRSYVLTGFPWALVGHIWVGTPVAQVAAVIGPVGLSALTVLLVALPVAATGPAMRGLAAALSVVAGGLFWAGGQARLDTPDPPREDPIRVRLIQPNAAQHLKWQGDMWQVFLDRQMEMTGAPAEKPLDLVVWPETSVPFLLDRSGDLFEEMTGMSGGVPMAFGIQRSDGSRYFNSLAATNGAGELLDVYDKWHLVPFGEYIPGGDVLSNFGITALAAQAGNGYSAGTGARLLDLGRAGRILPLICYEAIFPQDLRAADGRADWILQVTNDGWFGTLSGPFQHVAQARLRAIEQGLPFLRAANTGVTAVIDARGRVIDSLPLETEGFIDADVPPSLAPTIYARTGEWPVLGFIVVALGTMLAFRARRAIDPADSPL